MNAAVTNRYDFRKANTEVSINDRIAEVRLHGNLIARVGDNFVQILDGGWQSVTTKSRLNALCDAFCIDGEGVFQKDFQWYVRLFTGAINGKKVYTTKEFTNGFIFS